MSGLQSTLSGMNADSGFDSLKDLPPEAFEALQSLLAVQPGAGEGDVAAANTNTQAAYANVLEQLKNLQPPADQPVPDAPGGIEQFLALLSSNLASAVNPAFAKPTTDAIDANRTAREKISTENRESRRDFDKSRMERGFAVASQMAMESLKAASDAGDTKAATESALHLARIQDALERRRAKEKAQHDKDLEGIKVKNKGTLAELDTDELDALIEDIDNRGEDALKIHPPKMRAQLITEMDRRGKRIVPTSVRKAYTELAATRHTVDEIRNISEQINTAKADLWSRGITGAKNVVDALNESTLASDLRDVRGAFSGNLARTIGAERGVLTEQDRTWAMALVPGLFTSGPKAKRQIARLVRALDAKIKAVEQAYMSPGGNSRVPSLQSFAPDKEYTKEHELISGDDDEAADSYDTPALEPEPDLSDLRPKKKR